MAEAPQAPKLFISYSWTSPEHKQWVLDLAKDLRKSGVDALLDAWDIRAGQDPIAFMQQMVIDTNIRKVLMVVDKNYAEKANAEQGGVGIEAQIISREMYENTGQEKFVALVLDKDENGNPYLPIYCQSRIYIDFSEPQNSEKEFENLLRWIFSVPEHEKPPIGNPPAFLFNKTSNDVTAVSSFLHGGETVKGDNNNMSTHAHAVMMDACTGRNGDRWRIYQDRSDEWNWIRTLENGKIVGGSTEGYVNKSDCITNAQRNGMDCTPVAV